MRRKTELLKITFIEFTDSVVCPRDSKFVLLLFSELIDDIDDSRDELSRDDIVGWIRMSLDQDSRNPLPSLWREPTPSLTLATTAMPAQHHCDINVPRADSVGCFPIVSVSSMFRLLTKPTHGAEAAISAHATRTSSTTTSDYRQRSCGAEAPTCPCTRCWEVWYCTDECAQVHWQQHQKQKGAWCGGCGDDQSVWCEDRNRVAYCSRDRRSVLDLQRSLLDRQRSVNFETRDIMGDQLKARIERKFIDLRRRQELYAGFGEA